MLRRSKNYAAKNEFKDQFILESLSLILKFKIVNLMTKI